MIPNKLVALFVAAIFIGGAIRMSAKSAATVNGQSVAWSGQSAQGTGQSGPVFEIASVKINNNSADLSGRIAIAGRFTTTNIPLRFIVLYAFDLRDHQLVGDPAWAETTRFDVNATYPAGFVANERDVRVMVQRLLADRFKMTFHHEQQELPAYELVFARQDKRLGPQMARSDVDCVKWLADKRPQVGAGGPSPVAPGGKRPECLMMANRRFITAGSRPVSELTAALQSFTGRPVVDRTGLTGVFNFDMQWTPAASLAANPNAAPAPDDGPSIFTALQEQLGLKLESTKAPFDVVVVDRLDRPTEN